MQDVTIVVVKKTPFEPHAAERGDQKMKPKEYSPLTLAFLGDVVFELLVREQLVVGGDVPVKKLHQKATKKVCATAQCRAAAEILDQLTPEEESIFKRGRNANGTHPPKSATTAEYRTATGIEALFGYLYLKKDKSRMLELFSQMMK